jgi:hypothetical protein
VLFLLIFTVATFLYLTRLVVGEIGYYIGCIEACLIYSEKYPDLFSERYYFY